MLSGFVAKGVDGRAKGAVRSKAEPWNERRVKNVSLGAKGGFRLKPVIKGQQLGRKANLAYVATFGHRDLKYRDQPQRKGHWDYCQ